VERPRRGQKERDNLERWRLVWRARRGELRRRIALVWDASRGDRRERNMGDWVVWDVDGTVVVMIMTIFRASNFGVTNQTGYEDLISDSPPSCICYSLFRFYSLQTIYSRIDHRQVRD
jgi:hypothetical protein